MQRTLSQDDRQARLSRLGTEWGIVQDGNASSQLALSRPLQAPSYLTPNDDLAAEELLKRQRLADAQNAQSKGGLSRAFTTKKKNWEHAEIFKALVSHVTNRGSPGVAEALIARLNLAGGNVNLAQKPKSHVIARRKSMDLPERSQVLQVAVRNDQLEMVEVLLPYADALSLDTSLPIAIQNRNVQITESLVRYGAKAEYTAQEAFRQACSAGGQADLIHLILSSDGKPSAETVSQCMIEAAQIGCIDTVVELSRSVADGNYADAAALKAAVGLGRRDIALAIVLGNRPPAQAGLNEAFDQLMRQQNINPNDKLAMAEVLLLAGAGGDTVSMALTHAAATYFLEMVHLLVSFGASIEYQDAMAVRKAVSKGQVDLVNVMLNGNSPISPIYASECVELLPKRLRFEDRHTLLNHLLKKGASGVPLDEALIDAAEVGDVEAAKLLLTPLFPGGKIVGNKDLKRGPRSMVFDRHAVASTEHKGALALQIAIKKPSVPIVKLILSSGKLPSPDALAQVFPSVRTLPHLERYQMTEIFLNSGLSGPAVNSALENAVEERPPHRDERLIALLLRHNADVNFNEGAGITAAVNHGDIHLLDRLLKGKPTPQVAAKAVTMAMKLDDPEAKLQIVTMLISAGASRGGEDVSKSLATALQTKPPDVRLLQALLNQGNADVNVDRGSAVVLAAREAELGTLEMILGLGRPSQETIDRALKGLSNMPSSTSKAQKMDAILKRSTSRASTSSLLISEVQATVKTPHSKRTLATLKSLLAGGADVNLNNAEALGHAIAASDTQIVDLLFTTKPNPTSLSFALPHALRLSDPMDRLAFAKKILQGEIPPGEVNRALTFAINTYTDDIALINALLSRADTSDGEALLAATKNERPEIVELILSKKKFATNILNEAFASATQGSDKKIRGATCNSLLVAGAKGQVVSNALLAAASDGDLDFGSMLLQNGGSVDHRDGQAIVEASKSGASDVLGMLLSGDTQIAQETLQRGFQAATELRDLRKRAEVFKLLLEKGVLGEVVDVQLVSAGRYGDDGKELVRLLLSFGASPDYNNGEAVQKATQSAFLGSLEMLLGIVNVGPKHKKPSPATLAQAIKRCWDLSRDTRFTIMTWVFQAGEPSASTVHKTLNKAVNEDAPDTQLIDLLLSHGASPVAEGSQTLIDACRTLPPATFSRLLDSEITPEAASQAFSTSFSQEAVGTWLSSRGLQIATTLLEKGAAGDAVSTALVAVIRSMSDDAENLAGDFVEVLLKHGADVNCNHGEAVQVMASQANVPLLNRLLEEKPSSEALTLAFARIFDSADDEKTITELISIFTEHADRDNQMDVMFVEPGTQPTIIRALSQYPRSTGILQGLLDAGFYKDQMTTSRLAPWVDEDEAVNVLTWALNQPQKKISSNVINMLIDRGARVNFEAKVSRITPLMIAIETRRPDLVKSLLLAGAEVDIADARGESPLSMASKIGGDLAITMMSNLLAAGASVNDGSLHNASRELDLPAMQILVEYKHDPDFPSTLHGGRSALGEICLHAADSGELTAFREKTMEKAMSFLVGAGSDITLHDADGKSVLLLALESADPITTTRVLLRANMWRHINEPFNQYSDGEFTYSPTQYVQRVLPDSDHKPQLLTLLRSNRARDVYYANSGPQPEDAVNMPQHVLNEEKERKLRLARIENDEVDHRTAIQRNQELAAVQAQIWANQAELEDARKRRNHSADLTAMQERARVEEELFHAAIKQQRQRQAADMAHQKALTDAAVSRARTVGVEELALEGERQQRQLQWERDLGNERVGNANQLSSLRLREREEIERMDQSADARIKSRLQEQKKLVDSQSNLAANLNGANRRQIGYIAGEVD